MKIVSLAVETLRHAAVRGWRGRAVSSFLNSILRTFRPRKRVMLDNLNLAFPEKDDAWRSNTAKEVYRHLSWVMTEQLVLQRDPKQVLSWVDEIEGEEHMKTPLSQKRGAIMLGAHFGNLDISLAWAAQRGYPFCSMVRGPNDPDLDKLLRRYRENCGIKIFDRRDSSSGTLKLVRLLKEGKFIALAGDVHEGGGLKIPFLGRDCMTPAGAATLGLLADVPVVPFFLFRKAPFSHKAVILPPIKVPEGVKRSEQIELMTREINLVTENAVKAAPHLWFWLHKRWKS